MIYLHVGLGKCGSSTIQHTASYQAEALRAAGVNYPALVGHLPEQHKPLADFLLARLKRPGLDMPAPISAFHGELSANPNQDFLLSSEYFLGRSQARASAMANGLREFLGEAPVLVLIYIREYPAWVESLYAQRTKRGENTDDMDAFIRNRDIVNAISMVTALRAWMQVFGADNIRLRSLSRSNLVGGDLISDLLAAMGVDASLPAIERVNESPPWPVLELARDIASRRPDGTTATLTLYRGWLKRLVTEATAALKIADVAPPKPQYLNQADWAGLRDAYNSDVAQINQMLPNHAVPLMEGPVIGERGRVPSIRNIPEEALEVCVRAIAQGTAFQRMPTAMREAVRPTLRAGRRKLRRAAAGGTQPPTADPARP